MILTTLSPHVDNVVKVMATTSPLVSHRRSQWLIRCAYILDDEAKEGNEEDSENEEYHHG